MQRSTMLRSNSMDVCVAEAWLGQKIRSRLFLKHNNVGQLPNLIVFLFDRMAS
jgi:hypothetical protein